MGLFSKIFSKKKQHIPIAVHWSRQQEVLRAWVERINFLRV